MMAAEFRIYTGNVTLSVSTISGNAASDDGGGVDNNNGNLTIFGSTISDNSAVSGGGGIYSDTNLMGTRTTTITNSTISGNTASNLGGGGVFNEYGLIVIRHSTIANNTAPTGGGVASYGNNSTRTEVYSSIISGNAASDVDFVNGAVNSFQSYGFNLIGTGNALSDFNQAGDQTGIVHPMLGPLADNGGPTKTHAVLAVSPALDTGDPAAMPGLFGVPVYDQRFAPFGRVADGDGIGGARIDKGAYERQTVSGLSMVVDTLVDESDGIYSAGDFSLREAIGLANGSIGPSSIMFAGALAGGTITLRHGELVVSDELAIQGLGASLLTIDASGNDPTPDNNLGDGSRVFDINDVNDIGNFTLALSGLTLTGGDSLGSGGAIRSDEGLTLTGVTLIHNHSLNDGGGVISQDGPFEIIGSTLMSNIAGNDGGAIESEGTLIITGSVITGNTAGDAGGGLYVEGAVITGSTISGNTAGTNGGGIYQQDPHTVSITNSTISGNHANNEGGGIFLDVNGNLSVVASTISGNSAVGDGGGIHNDGYLTVYSSTISDNLTGTRGGGIWSNSFQHLATTTSVINSTISGNQAGTIGGGIYNIDGDVVIRHSTITDNRAFSGQGSGVITWSDPDTRTIVYSSIIAGNSISDVDLIGGVMNFFQSYGYNLIGTGSAVAAFNQAGDQTGVANPLLGSLADNGGLTMTHAVLSGSPAIDAGNPTEEPGGELGVPFHDQRGAPYGRVADGNGAGGARIDIGAFELQAAGPALLGDYNLDGTVDAGDYVVWRKTLGTGGVPAYSGADGDGDGMIDQDDLAVWKANFGNVSPGSGNGVGTGQVVHPTQEPAEEPPAQDIGAPSSEISRQPLKADIPQPTEIVAQGVTTEVQSADGDAQQAPSASHISQSIELAAEKPAKVAVIEQSVKAPAPSADGGVPTVDARLGIGSDHFGRWPSGRRVIGARSSAPRVLDGGQRDAALVAWLVSRPHEGRAGDDGQAKSRSEDGGDSSEWRFDAVDAVFEELVAAVAGV